MPRKTTNSSTDAVRKKITAFVEEWQAILRLDYWQITLKWEAIEDSVAEASPEDMYDAAVIKFDDAKLATRTDDYVEKTVIHELLHLIDRDRKMLFEEIEDSLAADTWRLFDRVVYQQTEAQIDRLASILYELKKGQE